MIAERAIEEFEKWSDDENEVVSSTTSTSEEAAPVPMTRTHFRTVTNDQLETAVKKRIPKGTQKSTIGEGMCGVLGATSERWRKISWK